MNKILLGGFLAAMSLMVPAQAVEQPTPQNRENAWKARLAKPSLAITTAFDEKGRLWLATIRGRHLYVSHSDDRGSTLSEPETAAILFQNAALPDKTIIEQMEVKNHQAALGYLFSHLQENGKIDEALILQMHAILLNGIQPDAGRYRAHGVRIAGSNVPTANYLKVPDLMQALSKDLSAKSRDILAHAVQIHSRFEQIHPFSDGNGRVGRLLLNAMLLRQNFPPALIRQEKRRFYMLYLNKAQLENDLSPLEDFICDAVLDAFNLLERR